MVNWESGDNQLITRRALLLGIGQAGLFGVLLARLSYLQLINREEYEQLAEENRTNLALILPERGKIYDRHGVELAGTQQNFQVALIPEQTPDAQDSLRKLARVIDLSARRRQKLLQEIRRSADFVPVLVKENLSWEQFSQINFLLPHMPGVRPQVGKTRYYPMKERFAHVLGYVAHPDENESKNDPLYRFPGFRVGKSGLERQWDKELRGVAGKRRLEINADGRVQREIQREVPQAGASVHVTINRDWQELAWKAMGEQSGAVVMVDVWTGDVMVLLSKPGFDPNLFNVGIAQYDWDFLLYNERKPLVNKAISGLYAPGSTFKIIVALAALESGVIQPSDVVDCTGVFTYHDEEFRCWRKEGHGEVDMQRAIAESCDSYFYSIAAETGIDSIEAMAQRFGLGQATDLNIPGEKVGTVPGRRWKRTNHKARWLPGETVVTGIGQGYVLCTPLQLAMMVARVANGGWGVKSRLVHRVNDEMQKNPDMQRMDLDPFGLELVKTAMYDVVNEPWGTAYGSRFILSGRRMAGKTGTSQVRRISQEEHETGIVKNRELDWHLRDHAVFVAFAPVDVPRYAICVLVEHGGSGSGRAAPIARRILYRALRDDLRATKQKSGETVPSGSSS